MKSKAVKVKKKDAEKLRRFLIKKDIIVSNLKIQKNSDYLYIPIKKVMLNLDYGHIIEKDFQKIEKKPNSYVNLLKLPEELMNLLPSSYDVIGDIILIKIPEDLLSFKYEIGKALLTVNKNIRSICLSNPVSGELRTRETEIIAGEKNTKTSHVEYGIKFELDIAKTYFSPRLANERKRVADQVSNGEIVVDMFTGVAPFPIYIAKYSYPKIIYAIDKNKDSIYYAKKNIISNQLLDKIEIINADAKEIKYFLEKDNVKADRIIMNLPFSSHLFFKKALEIASKRCLIHYYDILPEIDTEKRIEFLKNISRENNFRLIKLKINKIKTYAPRVFYIGIDITAKKMPM